MSELLAWSAAMVALVWMVQSVAYLRRIPEGTAVKRSSSPLGDPAGFTYPVVAASCAAALLLDVGTFHLGWITAVLQLIGLLGSIAGLVVELRAKVELGDSYSADARVWNEQQLVTRGLYGLVRHPIYLGSIALWLGIGLGVASWSALAIIVGTLVPALYWRSRLEERLLRERFGRQYAAYRSRVPMLSPWPRPTGTVEGAELAELVDLAELADQPAVPEQE